MEPGQLVSAERLLLEYGTCLPRARGSCENSDIDRIRVWWMGTMHCKLHDGRPSGMMGIWHDGATSPEVPSTGSSRNGMSNMRIFPIRTRRPSDWRGHRRKDIMRRARAITCSLTYGSKSQTIIARGKLAVFDQHRLIPTCKSRGKARALNERCWRRMNIL